MTAAAAKAQGVRSAERRTQASMRDGVLVATIVAMVCAAALAARHAPWTPGSDLGYSIGLAGGIALLGLFLYPLRKRWRRAQAWGASRGWFAAHMMLGIAAPLLVVLHSRLQFGSLNATIAFSCMALVAGSGVMGRFLYARIHAGLFDGAERAALALAPGRKAYLHVVRGRIVANGTPLGAGDALKMTGVAEVALDQGEGAEVLLFDLP